MFLSMVVGLAAAIAGAGEAGMIIMGMGQSAAQAQYLNFSRRQEGHRRPDGPKFLRRTHQSGLGMVHIFNRMANENARAGIDERNLPATIRRTAIASP